MRSRFSRRLTIVLCVAMLLWLAEAAASAKKSRPAPWQLAVEPVIDLSAFVGAPSCANALNELGTVVGTRRVYGMWHGFSWTSEAVVDLGSDTTALAVNDRGEIAGYGSVTGTGLRATLWTDNGTTSVRIAYGHAYSLNNSTEVVGFHIPPNTIYHAFRWAPDRGLEDVESLTGESGPWSYFTPFSEARFIRDDGVMAGWRDGMAVVWQPDGQVTTLGPGVVNSVNDAGAAIGATTLSDGRAVVWQDGAPTVITEGIGEAIDINTAGYVVGWMNVADERHGFVWHAGYGLEDLGPGEARNIDEVGDIAGCSRPSPGSDSRATVWRVNMTSAEYLLGFKSLARRLLAEVDRRSSRAIFRDIDLAQKVLGRSHGQGARRHLEAALSRVTDLVQSGKLRSDWGNSLLAIGRWIAGRL